MTRLNWQQIDTVLLDMDGTLLDLHFDNHFWLSYLPKVYAQHHQVSVDDALAELNIHFIGLRGTLEWYCLDHWSELTGLPIIELKQQITDKINYRPYAVEFLDQLQAMGKRRVIVTNAHRAGLQLKLEHADLEQRVDRIISSHDYREPKESQAFWQHLQQQEPFDPSRTLLIDDNPSVLESGQRYGIAELLHIGAPDSQKAPQRHGDFASIHHFNELEYPSA